MSALSTVHSSFIERNLTFPLSFDLNQFKIIAYFFMCIIHFEYKVSSLSKASATASLNFKSPTKLSQYPKLFCFLIVLSRRKNIFSLWIVWKLSIVLLLNRCFFLSVSLFLFLFFCHLDVFVNTLLIKCTKMKFHSVHCCFQKNF